MARLLLPRELFARRKDSMLSPSLSSSLTSVWLTTVCCALLIGLVGCGGESATRSDPSAGKGASCATSAGCPSGQACVSVGGVSACSLVCSAAASECTGSASCTGVGSVSLSVCEPMPQMDDPDSRPRLPCAADGECAALDPSYVCASFMGARDCTIVCANRVGCNPPSAGGLTTNFMDCRPDEGTPGRSVCVPDPACLSNPTSCYSFDGVPDGGLEFPDFGF